MNKLHKTLIAATFAILIASAICMQRRVVRLEDRVAALQFEKNSLRQQNDVLVKELEQKEKALASVQNGTSHSHEDLSSLLRLRAELTRLKGDSQELAALKENNSIKTKDPAESEMRSWLDRVSKVRAKLAQMPEQKIPEFQFLTDQDWLDAVRDRHMENEAEFDQALSALRTSAKGEFAGILQNALRDYTQAHNGQSATEMSQLKSYFASSTDDSFLQRYDFIQPGVVAEKPSPLGDQDDKYFQITSGTIGSSSTDENTLQQAVQEFAAANTGQNPSEPAQLLPYVKTANERTALQKLMQRSAAK